jgi:hypothetical protein
LKETTTTVKRTIDNILVALTSDDVKTVQAAMTHYQDLVDAFYHLHKDEMTPQQYEVSRTDIGYFMKMVELAEAPESQQRTR